MYISDYEVTKTNFNIVKAYLLLDRGICIMLKANL